MGKVVRAKISWIPANTAGRRALPAGLRYSTAGRFDEDAAHWPNSAWSIVVEFDEPLGQSHEIVASIHFLVSNAPDSLLHPGSRFELYEGSRVVAYGEVMT